MGWRVLRDCRRGSPNMTEAKVPACEIPGFQWRSDRLPGRRRQLKPLDYDELERWTGDGYERGMKSPKGER